MIYEWMMDGNLIYFFELRSYHRNETIEGIFSIRLIAQLTMIFILIYLYIYSIPIPTYIYTYIIPYNLYRCFMNDVRSCFFIDYYKFSTISGVYAVHHQGGHEERRPPDGQRLRG